MTKFCKICNAPLVDENTVVIDNSYTFSHRHCFHFTMENYCKILEIGTFKNIKEKYLSNSSKRTVNKPKSFVKNSSQKSTLKISS
jgi:hypothetical protein